MAFDPESATVFDPESAAETKSETPELPFALDKVKKGAAGALSIVGLPVDAINSILRVVPGYNVQEPFGGSAMIRKGYENLTGVRDVPADSKGQEMRGKMYEFAGGGLLPAGASIMRTPTIANTVGTLGTELSQSILGGGGAYIGNEVGGPVGEAAGGILGVLAGASSPAMWTANKVGQGGKAAYEYFKGDPNSVNKAAGAKLSSAMEWNPGAAAEIKRADEVAGQIERLAGGGIFNPRLSQRANSDAVGSIEHQVMTRNPQALDKALGVEGESLATINKAADQGVGLTIPPEQMSRAARAYLSQKQGRLEANLAVVEQQIASKKQDLAGRGQQEVGEELRELYSKRIEAARNVRDAKYADVYETADRTGFKTQMDDVISDLEAVAGSDKNAFQKIPPVYQQAIERWRGKSGEEVIKETPRGKIRLTEADVPSEPATFGEIHSLWKRANADYAAAQRSGDAFQMQFLGELKGSLKRKLDDIEQSNGELAGKFKEANRWYAENYARPFKEGMGGKLGATGRFDDLVKAEATTKQFFTPSGADDFYAVFGNDSKAHQALSDGVLDMFTRSGKSSEAFAKANAETLEKFPELKKTLLDGDATLKALESRAGRIKEAQALADSTAIAKLTKSQNPAGMVSRMVNDLDKRGLINLTLIDGPEAQRSVARLVNDAIPEAAAKAGKTPLQFITENEATFKPVMNKISPDHFSNLKTIAEAQTILGRGAQVPRSARTQAVSDPLEQATGTTIQSATNMARNVMVTRAAGWHGMATVLGAKFLNKVRGDKEARVIEEAMYDPKFARDLALAAKTPIGSAGQKHLEPRLNQKLLSLGIKVTGSSTEDE